MYVIELEGVPVPCDEEKGIWLYVGESSHTPEVRFAQHKAGYKAARWAKRYGVRLRPDLYGQFDPVVSTPAAEALERDVAGLLRDRGFCVRTGPARD